MVIAVAGTIEISRAAATRWPIGVAFLVLSCVALSLVRVAPLVVPVALGVLYFVPALLGFDIAASTAWVFPFPLAAFGAGLHVPQEQRWRGLASVMAMFALSIVTLEWLTTFDPNLVFGLAGSIGPWLFGVGLSAALFKAEQAAADLERAWLDGAMESARVVTRERERIASELHDVLAHTLGEMVVRTSVAKDALVRDARSAAGMLAGVAATGRAALAETGTLLRLLRDDADELGLGAIEPSPRAERSDTSRSRVTVADVAWPVLFAAVGTAEIVVTHLRPEPLWIAGCILGAAALAFRRRWPCATTVVFAALLAAPLALSSASDFPAAWIIGFGLATFSAGLRAPWRRGLVTVLAIVIVPIPGRGLPAIEDVVLSALFIVGPWAAGAAHARALARARAAGVAQEREDTRARREAEIAVEAERRRIARELNDVLASSLSVMIVQASLAQELAQVDAGAAVSAAASVELAGRRALGELGSLLRRSGEALPSAGIEPRQGIADIATLAAEFRRAGVRVDLDVDAVPGGLPAGVELATYRIVQEGLTNVLKHAPGSAAAVRLACDGPVVAIEVSNGPAGARPESAPSGHGLVGLRERVSHHGGEIAARRTADGGFRLTARLPAAMGTA